MKSNIGHAQAAAGVAGIIKMVQALRHGVLPKTLHVDEPTGQVDWSAGAVSLLSEARPWEPNGKPRRAGISSFGVSGTNAHVIVEEAPSLDDPAVATEAPAGLGAGGVGAGEVEGNRMEGDEVGGAVAGTEAGAEAMEDGLPGGGAADGAVADGDILVAGLSVAGAIPWVLSGRGQSALRAQAERLHGFALAEEDVGAADVGLSLAGRSALEDRAVVLGADRHALLAGMGAVAAGEPAPNVIEGTARDTDVRVAFLFTGQGAQRAGMGRELYRSFPSFRAALDEVCAALDAHLGRSVMEVLFAQEGTPAAGLLDDTMFTQAGLFALEVALLALLESWGMRPDYLAGHSIGELTAAFAAGVFSLEDACRLVAARGRLMSELPEGGAMIAVQASREEALESLAGFEDRVSLAAVNGPAAVVISGDESPVLELAQMWERQGRKVKRLRVSHAFHSPRMEGMLAEFLEVAQSVSFQAPRVPVISNLTGGPAGEELCSPEYWVRQVRETVRFADGVRWLSDQGVGSFLELGPDGVLSAMAVDCVGDRDVEGGRGAVVAVAVLKRERPEVLSLIAALAEMWVCGGPVDWAAMLQESGARRVELPTYAFQRRRHWLQSAPVPGLGQAAGGAAASDRQLLGDAEAGFWEAVEREDLEELLGALQVEGAEQRSFLGALLPSLSAWRRRSRERSTLSGWRYQVQWKPIAPQPVPALAGTWLVVVPAMAREDRWIAAVVDALEEWGARVVRVPVDEAGVARKELARALREATLDSSPGSLEQPPTATPVAGVLSLLALEEQHDHACASVPQGLATTVVLVQALGDAEVQAPLWMITNGAVSIAPSERLRSPIQAQSWGLGAVVGLEYPKQWGGLIDLPEALNERVLELVVGMLAGTSGEDQLAVRGAGIFARRVVRARDRVDATAGAWKPPRGTVLITGGTGGLGAHVARWLARGGAEHLLLVSRRGEEAPGARKLREELVAIGAEVTVAACDVAERGQLQALLESLPARMPLSAVVHAAGTSGYGPIDSLIPEALEEALSAKARAASHLDELTGGMDLAAFVLFSSIAGTFGSAHQAAYAAANAYLDALATDRRGRGLAATSVAWGAWAGEGMAGGEAGEGMASPVDGEVGEILRRRGIDAMAPELAIEALQAVLADEETCAVVADIRWERYAPVFASSRERPLIEDLPEAQAALGATGRLRDEAAARELRGRLADTPADKRRQMLLELIRTEVARVLGHPSPADVDAGRAFNELGFDSLLAVELRNRLDGATGLGLPATLVFDYPNPAAVADYLLGELMEGGASTDDLVEVELGRLEGALASPRDGAELDGLASRLRAMLAGLDGARERSEIDQQSSVAVVEQIQTASDDEIFGFIDRELGSS
jgi:acyl transferase domain-containing protein/acyl carrier protein